MTINIIKRPSTDKQKVRYTFAWGRKVKGWSPVCIHLPQTQKSGRAKS